MHQFFFDPAVIRTPEWKGFLAALDLVRIQYPTLTVGALRTLLELVARERSMAQNDETLVDVAEALSLEYPTLTRHTDVLGDGVAKSGGMKLIQKLPSPKSKKAKITAITPGGITFIMSLDRLLRPGQPILMSSPFESGTRT